MPSGSLEWIRLWTDLGLPRPNVLYLTLVPISRFSMASFGLLDLSLQHSTTWLSVSMRFVPLQSRKRVLMSPASSHRTKEPKNDMSIGTDRFAQSSRADVHLHTTTSTQKLCNVVISGLNFIFTPA